MCSSRLAPKIKNGLEPEHALGAPAGRPAVDGGPRRHVPPPGAPVQLLGRQAVGPAVEEEAQGAEEEAEVLLLLGVLSGLGGGGLFLVAAGATALVGRGTAGAGEAAEEVIPGGLGTVDDQPADHGTGRNRGSRSAVVRTGGAGRRHRLSAHGFQVKAPDSLAAQPRLDARDAEPLGQRARDDVAHQAPPVRAEHHAAVPPRHDDQGVDDVGLAQHAEEQVAAARLAVVVGGLAGVGAEGGRGGADAVCPDVVGRRAEGGVGVKEGLEEDGALRGVGYCCGAGDKG